MMLNPNSNPAKTDSAASAPARYQSFHEFWPFYLSQHANRTCRSLHFFGTTVGLVVFAYAIFTTQFLRVFYFPLIAYGCAWIGHFVFEKNRPATFIYPKWSLWGDFKMMGLFYRGKLDAEFKALSIHQIE